MNRKRSQVGEYDVPLPLWGDEPASSAVLAEQTAPRLNEQGALEGLIDAPRGVSVSLGARAMALANIMKYYNQANKTRGANASPGALQERYGARGTHEVTTNMSAKTAKLSRIASQAFDTLIAYDGMVETGLYVASAEKEKENFKELMSREYGPGNALAPKRKKVIRRANKIAGIRTKK